MDTPNFEDKKGKHPIPHAEGIAQDSNLQPDSIETGSTAHREEEE